MMKRILLLAVLLASMVFLVPGNTQAFTSETDITVNITSVFDGSNTVVQTPIVADYGTKLSFQSSVETSLPENYTFAFWVVNGAVQKNLAINHQFVITSTLDLVAVFNPEGQKAVLFMDSNFKLLKTQFVNTGGNASDSGITLPSKPGYVVAESKWNGSLENITEAKVFTLQYTLSSASTYQLTVNGGAPVAYDYNEVVTVTADEFNLEDDAFSHWIEDGVVVSRSLTYTFTMVKNRTITAVYMETPDANNPLVTITSDLQQRSGYQSHMGQFYVPQSQELVEYGFVMSQYDSDISLQTSGAVIVKANNHQSTTNEFLTSFPEGSYVSIRAYLITKNGSNLVTSYSEEVNRYQILNGGFETGNLYGWNAYGIWKNESGVFAWQQARVTNGTYFGSNPYGKDGTYNIGITWSGASWDQSAERMGHLRSSNFILGGSGWVSFKLGGGRTNSIAYVSVRRAKTHEEVARFGNSNYNNTTIATAQYGSSISNAEAFMFQYYFDLSSISGVELGDSLYIMLSDNASYDWSILSADSFITYYASAPTPGSNQSATNIVPTINTSGADNTIKNANPFVTGLTDWSNPNSSFTFSSSTNSARSNPTGDGDLGVLRSSAFNVSTNKYLRFDWAGGLKYDKQIFISIKEVGTNIEVIRIVRRDNLSNKESTDFDNHMVDLSGLDVNKLYYVELVDNRTGGWGVMWVRSMRLVPKSEWDSVTTGDRAVIVNNTNKFTSSSTYQYPLQYTWPTS